MNTMDVDAEYEPTDSAMPAVDAREPCHKHSLGITHQLSRNRLPTFLNGKTTKNKSDHQSLDHENAPEMLKPMAPERPLQGACTSTRIATRITRLLRIHMCMGKLSQLLCSARITP